MSSEASVYAYFALPNPCHYHIIINTTIFVDEHSSMCVAAVLALAPFRYQGESPYDGKAKSSKTPNTRATLSSLTSSSNHGYDAWRVISPKYYCVQVSCSVTGLTFCDLEGRGGGEPNNRDEEIRHGDSQIKGTVPDNQPQRTLRHT